MQSLYRRPLPEGSIAFGSDEGRLVFGEALAAGTLASYFPLAEQYHTQADPAFCGLGSLVMALNALEIDPGRLWKGPWRWFSEELLDCCVSLETVRQAGLTLDEVACLARCNGAHATLVRAGDVSEEALRAALALSSKASSGPFLVAAYDRAALGQTGHGHFSPLAGYHAGRDLALVLDVARFKYPPHWVPVSRLFQAMLPVDAVTGRSRGFMSLTRAQGPLALAFAFNSRNDGWRRVGAFVSQEAPRLLRAHAPEDADAAVRLVLTGAVDVATGIELRDCRESPHRAAVERILAQLRVTPGYGLASRATTDAPELACMLLYLLPGELWDASPAASSSARELLALERVDRELRDELQVLRRQVAALFACPT